MIELNLEVENVIKEISKTSVSDNEILLVHIDPFTKRCQRDFIDISLRNCGIKNVVISDAIVGLEVIDMKGEK